MKLENTYLRKTARVGKIYPKAIGTIIQSNTQSTEMLNLNNQSICLSK